MREEVRIERRGQSQRSEVRGDARYAYGVLRTGLASTAQTQLTHYAVGRLRSCRQRSRLRAVAHLPQSNDPIQSVRRYFPCSACFAQCNVQSTRPSIQTTAADRHSFIQLGFMVLGGSLEADRRIRLYEARKRVERRWMRERYLWEGVEAEAGAEVVKPGGSASEGSTSEGDG